MRIYIDDIYFLFFINRVSYYGNRFIIFVFDYAAAYNYYFLCNYFYHLYFIKIWNLIKIWIDSGLCEYFMGYTNTICNFVYCAQKNWASIILQSHSANIKVVQRQHYSRTAPTLQSYNANFTVVQRQLYSRTAPTLQSYNKHIWIRWLFARWLFARRHSK